MNKFVEQAIDSFRLNLEAAREKIREADLILVGTSAFRMLKRRNLLKARLSIEKRIKEYEEVLEDLNSGNCKRAVEILKKDAGEIMQWPWWTGFFLDHQLPARFKRAETNNYEMFLLAKELGRFCET